MDEDSDDYPCFICIGEPLSTAVLGRDKNERHAIWRENCEWDHIKQVLKEPLKRRRISNAEFSQHISILHDATENAGFTPLNLPLGRGQVFNVCRRIFYTPNW